MRLQPTLSFFIIVVFAFKACDTAHAQQYKLRQTTSMAGMKSESTIYVKGPRKRTEGGGYAGMTNPVTIEQCDLQRTIKINDKKKLYFIAPFSKDIEEIAEEDTKPVKTKPVATSSKEKDKTTTKAGGVIYMYYNITDTGERKKMYGITARHVWSTQKIKPSADACMMKDSMVIKTDGWYIDLPQFNCPVNRITRTSASTSNYKQPDCQDRYVSRNTGKGKLGFPLIETKTMIMGDGSSKTSQFESNIETLEFSTLKLDSMLFEIPIGYALAESEEELQDKFDVNEMIRQASNRNTETKVLTEEKASGITRIGVYEPKGDEQLQVSLLQKHLAGALTAGNIEAISVTSEEDAKKYNCDLLLTTEFTKVKQGSKVGGLLKAIKNTDPFATTSFNIEANLSLVKLSDGSTRLQQKVNGKYEGKADEAAMKALDKGARELLKDLD